MTGKLSEKTLMPLSLVFIIVGLLVGGAVWMTKVDLSISAHAAKIDENIEYNKKICHSLKDISERLSLIEGELKRIKK